MIDKLVRAAAEGRPLFTPDVRSAFQRSRGGASFDCVLTLPDGVRKSGFTVPVPDLAAADGTVADLAVRYARAEIYNHLTTLGGVRLDIHLGRPDARIAGLVARVVADFQTERSRAARQGIARIVNMLERLTAALHGEAHAPFAIAVHENVLRELPEPVSFRADPDDTCQRVTHGLERAAICGLDVGGTDIKAALALDGRLVALEEYDWNPAAYPRVEELIEPIVSLVQKLRVRAGRDLDGIGVSFPDVVVRNRIVGGEVPKTQAMRRNEERDFEQQFGELTRLNERLARFCRPGAQVAQTNDGPMAAFTAAVELAASPTPDLARDGVFAHTLGTDLGSGLVLGDGSIPEIPLEEYNLIIDLGSDPARALPAEDLRSLANTNTGVEGTPQRLTSQAGAFRLADEIFSSRQPGRLREIEERGFVVRRGDLAVVPESAVDRRKPYLSYLMELAGTDEQAAEIFRRIGEYMAVVYEEAEHILRTGIAERFLFGRFVKVPHCYAFLKEGARRRSGAVRLLAADSEMAYTPLMTELAADPDHTVAQFAQAVGAIYFANAFELSSTVQKRSGMRVSPV